MTKQDIAKRCEDYFMNGNNCSQTTAMVLSEYFNLSNDRLIDLAAPFGGGITATHAGLCGGISGALMIIGLLEKEHNYETGQELLSDTILKYNSHLCDKILQIDFSNEEQVAKEKGPKRETVCLPLLVSICEWVVDYFDKEN